MWILLKGWLLNCNWVLTLSLSPWSLTRWSTADQSQLIITAFKEGVENTGYFLSSWSVSIYESTGLRHRKGWWETRALCKAALLYTYNKGQSLSLSVSHWVFFFSFWACALRSIVLLLIVVWSQRFIKNFQWVEVLRKPSLLADVYHLSWPLSTHCDNAWLVVMDPSNLALWSKR